MPNSQKLMAQHGEDNIDCETLHGGLVPVGSKAFHLPDLTYPQAQLILIESMCSFGERLKRNRNKEM